MIKLIQAPSCLRGSNAATHHPSLRITPFLARPARRSVAVCFSPDPPSVPPLASEVDAMIRAYGVDEGDAVMLEFSREAVEHLAHIRTSLNQMKTIQSVGGQSLVEEISSVLKANARAASVDLSHLRITMDNVFVTLREGVEVGEGTKDLLLRQAADARIRSLQWALSYLRAGAGPASAPGSFIFYQDCALDGSTFKGAVKHSGDVLPPILHAFLAGHAAKVSGLLLEGKPEETWADFVADEAGRRAAEAAFGDKLAAQIQGLIGEKPAVEPAPDGGFQLHLPPLPGQLPVNGAGWVCVEV